jgi:hypothetical protein
MGETSGPLSCCTKGETSGPLSCGGAERTGVLSSEQPNKSRATAVLTPQKTEAVKHLSTIILPLRGLLTMPTQRSKPDAVSRDPDDDLGPIVGVLAALAALCQCKIMRSGQVETRWGGTPPDPFGLPPRSAADAVKGQRTLGCFLGLALAAGHRAMTAACKAAASTPSRSHSRLSTTDCGYFQATWSLGPLYLAVPPRYGARGLRPRLESHRVSNTEDGPMEYCPSVN